MTMNKIFLQNVPRKMRLTGMLLFRDGFLEACNGENFLCVVHVAQSAEILLKARIAQENLISIFSNPSEINLKNNNLTQLEWLELVENQHTLKYWQLPGKLLETVGINIKRERIEQYQKFGKLRNAIVHLGSSREQKLDKITIRYSLQLLDPLVESFWGRSVFDFIRYDLMSEYSSLLAQGFLETKIKKFLPIDTRLRRVLGEKSKKSLEFIETLDKFSDEDLYDPHDDLAYQEYIGSYYEKYKDNDVSEEEIRKYQEYREEYDRYIKENPEIPSDIPSYDEVIEYWENFLNSF